MRREHRLPIQDPDRVPIELSEEEALPLLQSGEVIGGYRMPWGSNYTFLVAINAGPGTYFRAIYKPRDGERPLYDFPTGSLYKREFAAYLLSRTLGWPDVPLTLIRDGPYRIGSMQLYVGHDPEVTYFDLVEDRVEEMQQLAVFDLLVNNADRKAGHCLLGDDGRVWSIDHGLTFHPMFKLRTVMLDFWGKPISRPLLASLEGLGGRIDSSDQQVAQLAEIMSAQEMDAMKKRLDMMLEHRALPALDPYRDVPWPWM